LVENVKMFLIDVVFEDEDWIHLTHDKVSAGILWILWWTFWFHKRQGFFLTTKRILTQKLCFLVSARPLNSRNKKKLSFYYRRTHMTKPDVRLRHECSSLYTNRNVSDMIFRVSSCVIKRGASGHNRL
jgi:hypothetical protein